MHIHFPPETSQWFQACPFLLLARKDTGLEKFLPLQGSVYYHQECGYHPRVIQTVLCTPGFPHHPLHSSVLYVRSSFDWAPPFPHMKRGLLCFVTEATESASSTPILCSIERKQVQWMWLSLRGEGIYILDKSNLRLAF